MSTENVLIGQATEDQIREWKEKYGDKTYALEVDGYIGYFRNPNRKDMNAAMSRASADAALDMYELLARLTWLGGSDVMLTDDDMFYGITAELKKKMDGKKAVLKNL